MPVTIRPIRMEDAEAYLKLACALDSETKFMMMEPGERTTTVEEQRKRISSILSSGNSMIFVAEEHSGRLVGLLGGVGGAYKRNRETVHIFVGILQAYAGQGLGRRLFETLETWARAWGAHRLELTVMCHNQLALALYQKMGFTIEGRMRDALKIDGEYVDEFAMCKILE